LSVGRFLKSPVEKIKGHLGEQLALDNV
jgi:hypothetical protein